MSDNYVGEIRMFAGNYAPVNWALCDGSLLPVTEFQMLFAVLGTTYGGDGSSTFAIPDLRGRLPVHQGHSPGGSPYMIGQAFGTETVALSALEMPQHTHGLVGTADSADSAEPGERLFAETGGNHAYNGDAAQPVPLSSAFLTESDSSQPHDNRMPALGVNFIIALTGAYPSRD